jgi:hypothetical protein
MQTNQQQIEDNLSLAQHIASGLRYSAIPTVANLFVCSFPEKTYLLHPKGLSKHVREAQEALAALEQYLERKLNVEAPSEEQLVHFSKRKVHVAKLLEAYIKASLAQAYVELWNDVPAYNQYGALGHQALAYADCTKGDNWDFFAAPVFYRPEEALLEEIENNVRLLSRYGEAALSYGRALHGQMGVAPARLLGERFEPLVVPTEDKPVVPMSLPEMDDTAQGLSQERFREIHVDSVRDDKVRDSCYGYNNGKVRPSGYLQSTGDVPESCYGHSRVKSTAPLRRLVGFHTTRGGRNH